MTPALVDSDLTMRLRRQGLPSRMPVRLHANRSVLVTLTAHGALRLHAGFAAAPDAVIEAIVRWARPRAPRRERLEAQRVLTRFPVHEHVAGRPRRPRSADPADVPVLQRLAAVHRALNDRHFDALLGPVTIRLSDRMRRRLGEFRLGSAGGLPEITLSRRHLRREGWVRAEETFLHEMVHQWQAESGRRPGHGRDFREKCAALGIEGRAAARRGGTASGYLAGAMALTIIRS